MSLETEEIQRMLEEELEALAESKGEGLARQVKPILLANLDRGRIQTFTEGDPDLIRAYAWRVAETFAALNPYLHQLQTKQSREAWEPLFERMRTWAYNFFLRKGFAADDHTRDTAIECAADAAVNIISAHFPYDTEFDPWAHIIVQNACRKYIHRSLKKSAIPENQMVELDDHLVNKEELLLELWALEKESRGELEEALLQLTEARRTVIQLIFFEGLDPEQAAQKMEKSVSAIYTLQFHALRDLRKILITIRDTSNE